MVCLDIADVVRDELTILKKEIEDLHEARALMSDCERNIARFQRVVHLAC